MTRWDTKRAFRGAFLLKITRIRRLLGVCLLLLLLLLSLLANMSACPCECLPCRCFSSCSCLADIDALSPFPSAMTLLFDSKTLLQLEQPVLQLVLMPLHMILRLCSLLLDRGLCALNLSSLLALEQLRRGVINSCPLALSKLHKPQIQLYMQH